MTMSPMRARILMPLLLAVALAACDTNEPGCDDMPYAAFKAGETQRFSYERSQSSTFHDIAGGEVQKLSGIVAWNVQSIQCAQGNSTISLTETFDGTRRTTVTGQGVVLSDVTVPVQSSATHTLTFSVGAFEPFSAYVYPNPLPTYASSPVQYRYEPSAPLLVERAGFIAEFRSSRRWTLQQERGRGVVAWSAQVSFPTTGTAVREMTGWSSTATRL